MGDVRDKKEEEEDEEEDEGRVKGTRPSERKK